MTQLTSKITSDILKSSSLSLLGFSISSLSVDDLIKSVVNAVKEKRSEYHCFTATHNLVEGVLSKRHNQALQNARNIFPDGMPIVKILNLFRQSALKRISGIDTIEPILQACLRENLSIAFYGGEQQMLSLLQKQLNTLYPTLKCVGFFSPPMLPVEQLIQDKHLKLLKEASPDIILVFLGCPKQEYWMHEAHKKINSVYLGLGFALTLYTGGAKRAPVFLQNLCLEWFYRLVQSPRKLFWRYSYYNTLFVYFLFLDLFGFRFKQK